MYITTIKKELLQNILSLRYALTFFLFLALTLTATVVRTQIYKKQVTDHFTFINQQRASMDAVETDYQSEWLGIMVEKAPNPLAIFASGLENEMTRSFSMSSEVMPAAEPRKLTNPSFQYFIQLDFALIVNIVCSLLALLLIFDAVCGERESGTLKMLLSGPLPRDVIIVSKLCAGLLTLMVPLTISWVLSLVYVTGIAGIGFSPEQIERLAWLAVLSAAYIGLFFALGMAISCWTQRSATALAGCLFCWIIAVLAIPNLVPMAVKRLAPIPPQSKIALEAHAIQESVWKVDMPKWREEMGSSGRYDDIEKLNSDLYPRVWAETQKRTEALDRYCSSRIARQLNYHQQLSRLSPSASYLYASTHLAQTGVPDFLAILNDVDQFQRAYLEIAGQQREAKRPIREALDERIRKDPKLMMTEKLHNPYDPALWPKFDPKDIALAKTLNQCWIDIVLLFGLMVFFFFAAFVGFLRYDVR
jgi:ABC-type transport system involved in multi-copper enzyme maturation permease subunit